METLIETPGMDSFVESLSRAAAEVLEPSPGTIDIRGTHHQDALSLLSTLADLASAKSPAKSQESKESLIDSELPSRLRPRALSESWANEDTWRKNIQIAQDSNKNGISTDVSGIILPYMLDKYSSIYNKNGRIGIYSRDERDVIIQRFKEKRRRRVWNKKIRYHCRKNLADRRIRVYVDSFILLIVNTQ